MKILQNALIFIFLLAMFSVLICFSILIFGLFMPEVQSNKITIDIGKYIFSCVFIMIFCLFVLVIFKQ